MKMSQLRCFRNGRNTLIYNPACAGLQLRCNENGCVAAESL
jgi:hypothetical protein